MKDKIREILIKHSDNKNANDKIEAELLDLFSVSKNEVTVCSLYTNKPDCVEYQIEGGKTCINCKWRKQTVA
jgi:hypothetical protein